MNNRLEPDQKVIIIQEHIENSLFSIRMKNVIDASDHSCLMSLLTGFAGMELAADTQGHAILSKTGMPKEKETKRGQHPMFRLLCEQRTKCFWW